jgi:hypothetical protein
MTKFNDDVLLKNYSVKEEKTLFKEWLNEYKENDFNFDNFFNNLFIYLPFVKGKELNRAEMITFNLEKKHSDIYDNGKYSKLFLNQTRREFFTTIDDILKKNNVYDFIVNIEDPHLNREKIMKASIKSYFDLRRMGYNRYLDLIG